MKQSDLSLKTPDHKTKGQPSNLAVIVACPTDNLCMDMYPPDITFGDIFLHQKLLEGIYDEVDLNKPS